MLRGERSFDSLNHSGKEFRRRLGSVPATAVDALCVEPATGCEELTGGCDEIADADELSVALVAKKAAS